MLWPQQGFAQEGGGLLDAIGSALAWIVAQLNYFLGVYILLPLINFMVGILEYNGFLDSYAVQIGWPLVRDLTNMFFVIILLIIAFSTILHISSYHYKNTLLKLIIMALLINFSKPILGFMIDFAQVIMLTFVDAFRSAAISAMSYAFGITAVGTPMIDFEQTQGFLEREDILATTLLDLVFLIVAIAVIMVYVAVLLWRILNLWILVIFSPFAFLAVAFPGLKKYSSEFWNRFWNQLTIGVILAFCLWLAFILMAAGVVEQGETLTQELIGEVGGETSKLWERVYVFIISIALLLLGLQYAQQAGGFAGAFAGKVGGKLSEGGTKAIKTVAAPLRGAGYIAKTAIKRGRMQLERKLLLEPSVKEGAGPIRRGLKYLTKAGWEGWTKRGDTLLEQSRQVVSGAAYDSANRRFAGIETTHQETAESRIAKEKAEEMNISGLEDLKTKFTKAMHMAASPERDRVMRGLFAVASREAWVDDLMAVPEVMEDILMDKGSQEYGDYMKLKGIETGIRAEVEADTTIKEEDKEKVIGDRMEEESDKAIGRRQRTADAHVEIINRRKTGDFLKFVATDHRGNLTQAGLDLIYEHEQNAFNTGHYEDIGYARVDEDPTSATYGKKRLLDYKTKKANGLTAADEMGLVEVSKRDPAAIVRMQVHSAGPRRVDGTNSLPEKFHETLIEIAGRSNETHRLNLVGRTANVLMGGTATAAPSKKEKGDITSAIHLDSLDNLRSALSTYNAQMNFGKAAYYKSGADFIDEKGDKLEVREGANRGYGVINYKDKEGNQQTVAISYDGKVYDAKRDEEGRYQVNKDKMKHNSIAEFADDLGLELSHERLEESGYTDKPTGERRGPAPEKEPAAAPRKSPAEKREEERTKTIETQTKELGELSTAIEKLTNEISEGRGTLKPEVMAEKQAQLEQKQKLAISGNLQLAMQQSGASTLAEAQGLPVAQRKFLFEQFRKNTENLKKLQRGLSEEMYDKLVKDLVKVEHNLVDKEFTDFFNSYGVS